MCITIREGNKEKKKARVERMTPGRIPVLEDYIDGEAKTEREDGFVLYVVYVYACASKRNLRFSVYTTVYIDILGSHTPYDVLGNC